MGSINVYVAEEDKQIVAAFDRICKLHKTSLSKILRNHIREVVGSGTNNLEMASLGAIDAALIRAAQDAQGEELEKQHRLAFPDEPPTWGFLGMVLDNIGPKKILTMRLKYYPDLNLHPEAVGYLLGLFAMFLDQTKRHGKKDTTLFKEMISDSGLVEDILIHHKGDPPCPECGFPDYKEEPETVSEPEKPMNGTIENFGKR